MKRLLSAILATLMILSLCACAGGGQSGEGLEEGTVVKMTVPSSPSWPYREDWKVWEYIEEGSGATLDIQSVPTSDASTKYSLIFADPETVPDVAVFTSNTAPLKYARQGALVAFDDLASKMPAYSAWLDGLSEEIYNSSVKTRKAADGKIYYSPLTGREGMTRMRCWMYREDIFEKHNLEVPTTFDELYEVLKKLKALYPDSYPYVVRGNFDTFNVVGSSFDKWWQTEVYYDYDDEEWRWGATEDTMREVILFYKKLIDEKLMPSDFFTLNVTAWEELITTNRGFIMPHFTTRLDYFDPFIGDKIPGFKFTAFVPPVANPEKGAPLVMRSDIELLGFSIPNSGDDKRIENAAKLVDWFYTDEAYELMSWGKEGETYEVVDGEKQFITDDAGNGPSTLYGFQLHGTFTRIDPEAAFATQTERTRDSRELIINHTLPDFNPTTYLDFTEEEEKVKSEIETSCHMYTEEMVLKMLLGQEPVDKLDEMKATLEEMRVNELLDIYKTAYDRIK